MKVLVSDIRDVDPIEALRYAGLSKEKVSVVAGGLPCQGFSESNKRTRTIDNPLNSLYKDFFRFTKVIQPRLFVIENVGGLTTLAGGHFLSSIISQGLNLGYSVQWKILNAHDYGVLQSRKRIVIIGTKEKAENLFLI